MKILVTGASGFVGVHLCHQLTQLGHQIIRQGRPKTQERADIEVDLSEERDPSVWLRLLNGIDVVVHVAALTHSGKNADSDSWEDFLRINVLASERLFRAAQRHYVKKFIFISSVKAIGERTEPAPDGSIIPLGAESEPAPEDNYGKSKLSAERRLIALSGVNSFHIKTNYVTELAIIRPPLLYGHGQKGNMARLYRLIGRGLPLPLGAINNRRSLLSVNNLCSAIGHLVEHQNTIKGVFFLADVDVSTTELAYAIAVSLKRTPRFFSVPPSLLRLLLVVLGRKGQSDRLLNSLVIDSSEFCRRFSWSPPHKFESVLKEIAASRDSRN